MKARWYLFVVIFPIAIMALWCGSLGVAIARGTEVSLKITGSDPRDLLRGHYLRYQVLYGLESEIRRSTDSGRAACLCLSTPSDGVAQGTWIGACEERDTSKCPLFIKGTLEYGAFRAGIERYYFSEDYKSSLATVPAESTITVRVTADGTGYVQGMYVAGEPIEEYARRKERE